MDINDITSLGPVSPQSGALKNCTAVKGNKGENHSSLQFQACAKPFLCRHHHSGPSGSTISNPLHKWGTRLRALKRKAGPRLRKGSLLTWVWEGMLGEWEAGAGATKMLGPIVQLCSRSACTKAEAKPDSKVTAQLMHLRLMVIHLCDDDNAIIY